MRKIFQQFQPEETRREIGEELRFHVELLTAKLLEQDLSLEEARTAARLQFGDVEKIQNECARIKRRHSPLNRALKLLLILIVLSGILIRVFAPEYHVTRVGDILIAVGILGRLWLYVRGLTPSFFLSSTEAATPLRLIDRSPASIAAYDAKKRTPVERVIFDK